MKKSFIIPLLVGLAIATSCGHHSSLNSTWIGTHHIESSTDGPSSFNSQECKTFSKLTMSGGELSGSITQFGLNARGFANMEELRGTISSQAVEWKSTNSLHNADKAVQCVTVFHGTLSGDTISGHFDQTFSYEDGKSVTYGGAVELKKQPE